MEHYQATHAYVVGKACLMAALFVDMWLSIPMGLLGRAKSASPAENGKIIEELVVG